MCSRTSVWFFEVGVDDIGMSIGWGWNWDKMGNQLGWMSRRFRRAFTALTEALGVGRMHVSRTQRELLICSSPAHTTQLSK